MLDCAKQYLGNDMMGTFCSIFDIHYDERIDDCTPENNPDLGQCKLVCHFLKLCLM
jgi:hypothetical protein